jgi:alpha-acetolactate decarboxylase
MNNNQENTVSELHAKPIIDGKFWIVEDQGNKVGILKVTEQKKYVFSSKDKVATFDTKKKLVEQFGKDFFQTKISAAVDDVANDVYGYPTSTTPHNPMFDVKRNLPLFTKSNKSKVVGITGDRNHRVKWPVIN